MTADFYAVLDVTADASREEIKRAYRRRVRETHPDTGGKAEDFHAVQEAWEVLGDDGKRASYDRVRTRVFSSDAPTPPAGNFASSSYFSYGTNLRSDTFNEEMSNRIKTEASRLFEQVRQRQREAALKEQEIQDLGRPTFPLYNSSLGSRINQLYIEGTLWGIPIKQIRQWKKRDTWGIRVFLGVTILINLAVLVFTIADTTARDMVLHISENLMYTAFIDLVALFIAFIIGGVTAFYRFTKYGLKKNNRTVNFKL